MFGETEELAVGRICNVCLLWEIEDDERKSQSEAGADSGLFWSDTDVYLEGWNWWAKLNDWTSGETEAKDLVLLVKIDELLLDAFRDDIAFGLEEEDPEGEAFDW